MMYLLREKPMVIEGLIKGFLDRFEAQGCCEICSLDGVNYFL